MWNGYLSTFTDAKRCPESTVDVLLVETLPVAVSAGKAARRSSSV
jgi:hypothetical protein